MRVIGFVHAEFAADLRRNDGQGQPVRVIDHCGEKKHRGDYPSKFGNCHDALSEMKPKSAMATPGKRSPVLSTGGSRRNSMTAAPAGRGTIAHCSVCSPLALKSRLPRTDPFIRIVKRTLWARRISSLPICTVTAKP